MEAETLFFGFGGTSGGSPCCCDEMLAVDPAEASDDEGDSFRKDIVLENKATD